MPKKHPLVCIILVTYRMCDVALRCLQSLKWLSYPNYRIIVVDNNSGDGIERVLTARFPEIELLQSDTNLGYTGGNNLGIERAITLGADYVLILNPDTEVVNPQFVNQMVAYTEAFPEVGIAGPRVFFRRAGLTQNTVLFPPGLWRNIANWVAYRISPRSFDLSKDNIVDAEVLNGVCLLVRIDCLKQVGLFDENIFMYIEDADLDYRARKSGWGVRYLPFDSVIHLQKQEGYHMTGAVSFLLKRNSVYYLNKIGKPIEAWGFAVLSLVMLTIRGVLTFRSSSFFEYAAFCRKLARAYRQILLKRPFDWSFGPPFTQNQ